MVRTSLSERKQMRRCKSIFTLFLFLVMVFVACSLLFRESHLVVGAENINATNRSTSENTTATNHSQFICADTLTAFSKVFRMDDGSEIADCRSVVISNIMATIREKWHISSASSLSEKDDSVILEILFWAVLGHDFDNIDMSTEHTTIIVDSHTGLLRRNNSMDRHRMVALEFMVIIALLTLGYIWIQDMQTPKTNADATTTTDAVNAAVISAGIKLRR